MELQSPRGRRAVLEHVGLRRPASRGGVVVVTEGASDAVVVAALDRYDVATPRGAGDASKIADALGPALTGRTASM